MRSSWFALFVSTLVAVTTLALMPQPPHALDSGWDKLNHALAFGVLMALALRAWRPASWRALVWTAAALLAYGAAIEVAQSFVPGRSAEALDLLADAVGLCAGAALWKRRTRAR